MTLLLLWFACSDGAQDVDLGPAAARDPHILVVGVDGMRPDALALADAPRMRALMDDGASTWVGQVQTDVPPISGPGWATLLTGVDPKDHLVDSNDDLGDRSPAWPTTLQRVREHGGYVSEVINWIGIFALTSIEAYDELRMGDDAEVGVDAAARVAAGDALVWTHFNDVDSAGHATGFSPDNPDYIAEIEDVDDQIGPAIDAVGARSDSEAWMIALVTDHGGHGTGHSEEIPECRTIPMAIWVEGEPARDLGADAHQHDLAPTMLDWMGVPYEGLTGASWL